MEPFQPLGGATAHPAGASECLKQGGSPPPSRHTPVAQRPTAPLPCPCHASSRSLGATCVVQPGGHCKALCLGSGPMSLLVNPGRHHHYSKLRASHLWSGGVDLPGRGEEGAFGGRTSYKAGAQKVSALSLHTAPTSTSAGSPPRAELTLCF